MRNIGFDVVVVCEKLVEIQRSRMAEERIVKILKVSNCCFREDPVREEVDRISVLIWVKRHEFVEIVEISSSWKREMKVWNAEEGADLAERV